MVKFSSYYALSSFCLSSSIISSSFLLWSTSVQPTTAVTLEEETLIKTTDQQKNFLRKPKNHFNDRKQEDRKLQAGPPQVVSVNVISLGEVYDEAIGNSNSNTNTNSNTNQNNNPNNNDNDNTGGNIDSLNLNRPNSNSNSNNNGNANTTPPAPAPVPAPLQPPPTLTPPQSNTPQPPVSPNGKCPNQEYVDVVIVGAGMAGIKAAATLQEETADRVSYVILESTNRSGGRVKSHSFNGYTVEEGANWIYQFNNNPMLQLSEQYALQSPMNDYSDYKTYDENGIPMDTNFVQTEIDRFTRAWTAAAGDADNQWTRNHESYPDNGVRALLANEGWTVPTGSVGSLDYAIQWFALDWEYAASDTSVRYFPFSAWTTNLVNDQRGYEYLPQSYLETNADPNKVRYNTRVTNVNYDENVVYNGKTYKTLVNTQANEQGCTDYYAQRTILTVSSGVISNNLISFNPPLQYPDAQYNPYYMTQYVKIFYQFPNKFWDDNELIRVLRDEQHRGQCHHWGNMDHPKFYPGSRIIRCEIMTEAFDTLKDPVTQDLSQETLLSLLDPLRTAYGRENVPVPMDVYYPKMNKNADWGYGGYANWKIGKTFADFAKFYGGYENIARYCEHNGCNAAGERTLLFSGAASCFEHAELVHGAFFAGEKAAYNVMQELGYDVNFRGSPCDESLSSL